MKASVWDRGLKRTHLNLELFIKVRLINPLKIVSHLIQFLTTERKKSLLLNQRFFEVQNGVIAKIENVEKG